MAAEVVFPPVAFPPAPAVSFPFVAFWANTGVFIVAITVAATITIAKKDIEFVGLM